MVAMLLLLGAIEGGSGTDWRCLYASGRDGTGPPNVTLQVATSRKRPDKYRLSLYLDDYGPEKKPLVESKEFNSAVRFVSLEDYSNPVNDIWEVNGQTHKQFPHLLFVGQGIEAGKKVTFVWSVCYPGGDGA